MLDLEPIRPRNTSAEEQAMREVARPWIKARWGDDVRCLHELALGDRRVDMVVVGRDDLAAIEFKGPRDRLDNDRLPGQLKTFKLYMPEIWLLVAPKWQAHDAYRFSGVNNAMVGEKFVSEEPPRRRPADRFNALTKAARHKDPVRDDCCCGRLLELLWVAELHRVAARSSVAAEGLPTVRVRGLLARLLTGHEIVKQVCTELRARPAGMVGMASTGPIKG